MNTIIYITLPKHHQNYFATMHKTQAIPCSHSAISAAPYTFCSRKTHTIRHLHTFGLETNMDENARNVQIILMLNYSSLCATSCMKSETLRAYSSALGEQSALREGSALPQRRRMCIVEAKPPVLFVNILSNSSHSRTSYICCPLSVLRIRGGQTCFSFSRKWRTALAVTRHSPALPANTEEDCHGP